MTKIAMSRSVTAPPQIVWEVITDHELYAEAAPNLSHVEVLEGDERGMVRRCVDTNDNEWTEVCTHWSDGEAFAVSVDVDNSVFHRRLFSRFEGEWGLSERSDSVLITVEFEFDTRYGRLGYVISKYFEQKAPEIIEPIFDRWEAEIESRLTSDSTEVRPIGTSRS